MKPTIKCQYCKSDNVVMRGLSPTENRGKQQRYLCNDCKRTFIPDFGFWKMKNSESKITQGIDLYFSNLSSRKVRNHFRRHIEHNVSHITILDWCRKYVLKVNGFVDKLQPKLGGRYYADETEIDREGVNDLFWCCIDWDTRMIVDTHYSLNSGVEQAKEFLEKVQRKGKPKYIQTDSAHFYPKAMRQVFSANARQTTYHGIERVQHRVVNTSKTGKYNVRIETVFSKIKDRVYDFRGLKALWSAPILMQGIVLQHNFIEAHTTTGQIPAELAELKLEVGQNRWLGLIKLASKEASK